MRRYWIWTLLLALFAASELFAGKGGNKGGGGGGGGGGGEPADPAIAFTQDNDVLSVMDEDGANATDLLSAQVRRAAWSPDGNELAFFSNVDGPGIYRIGVDGTGLVKVVATSGPTAVAWSPGPSPDGREKLSFGQDGDLHVVDPDGSGLQNLTAGLPHGGNAGTWSPEADRIAVGHSIYTLGLIDGDLAITSTDSFDHGLAVVTQLDWANGSDRIVLAGSESLTGAYELYVVDLADPGNPVNISNTPGQEERFPGWSPDDARIVFWTIARRGKGGIQVMASDGSGSPTRIHSKGFAPSWRRNP